ncbi:hypothetical protein VTL71DRAFT_15639 [Oculimacula yallundae]|uniref:Uncharacterized protein n=1 Tax=Oculimacula yallundae TaxID=86028 RepID=A0ABR4CJ93_9HELO
MKKSENIGPGKKNDGKQGGPRANASTLIVMERITGMRNTRNALEPVNPFSARDSMIVRTRKLLKEMPEYKNASAAAQKLMEAWVGIQIRQHPNYATGTSHQGIQRIATRGLQEQVVEAAVMHVLGGGLGIVPGAGSSQATVAATGSGGSGINSAYTVDSRAGPRLGTFIVNPRHPQLPQPTNLSHNPPSTNASGDTAPRSNDGLPHFDANGQRIPWSAFAAGGDNPWLMPPPRQPQTQTSTTPSLPPPTTVEAWDLDDDIYDA